MIKIRCNVFETNSSSTHSLCIAMNDEIEKLKNNELLIYLGWNNDKRLISYEEAIKELEDFFIKYDYNDELDILKSGNQEEIYRLLYEYDIAARFEYYMQDEYLEPYDTLFTTPNGDKVYVFGQYGHD